MLQGINKFGQSWAGRVIATVLFGVLIVSFAIWGIGDVFRGTIRSQVATVGGQDISADAFRNAYQTELQALIRQQRRPITPEQARAIGLEGRVLTRLVNEAALDHEVRDMRLGVSDALVIRSIEADPNFRGADGRFDRNRFYALIRDAGLTEAQYVREQRGLVTRNQINEGLAGAATVPLALRDAVHRFQTEKRSAEMIRLGPAVLGTLPAPTDAQLETFFNDRKASFRAPEFRALRLLVLDPARLAKPDAVSDADARQAYAEVRDDRYGKPEKRTIQQIIFPTQADAEAASAKIKAGTSFEEIARERGVDDATLNLGSLSRGEVVDPTVAEAAFGLAAGGTSGPIAGRFGPVLVHVTAVEPGAVKPFEEVAAEIKSGIALERARTEAQTVHDAIEDDRSGAKTLEAIAHDRGLPLVTVPAVDARGETPDGKPAEGIPNTAAVLAAAFRSEIGADTEAVPSGNGGYVWYDVTGSQPAHDRPLAEVKAKVEDAWRQDAIATGLADKARALVERLDKGEAPAAIGTELSLPVQSVADLSREGAGDAVPAPVVLRVFATPVGKAGSVATSETERVLFQVTGATAPPFVTTTQDSEAMAERLRTITANDLMGEYVDGVKKRIGVTIYPANVRRAIGGES